MPLTMNKNLAAFQQLAKKAATTETVTGSGSSTFLDYRHQGHTPSTTRVRSLLNISGSGGSTKLHHRTQSGSESDIGFGEVSSLEDVSSGEGSDAEAHRGDKKKGLMYQKTENVITRMRDLIAQWDVFTARSESPPFVACLKVSVWFIPLLLMLCVWDTIAIAVFEVPHHCWNDYPGFLLVSHCGWHFVMMILAMYGFMLSYLSSGSSPRTKLAAISLGVHYLLLLYRIFMEIHFNGFRGQSKLYIERSLKRW